MRHFIQLFLHHLNTSIHLFAFGQGDALMAPVHTMINHITEQLWRSTFQAGRATLIARNQLQQQLTACSFARAFCECPAIEV
jgi:hypothetical protein